MFKSDRLTREIIFRMMGNLGLLSSDGVGLFDAQLCLSDELVVVLQEDEKISYPMWGGQIESHGLNIKAVAVNLTEPKYGPEFAVCFRSSNNPIYSLRLSLDNDDNGVFLIRDIKGWVPASVVTKCRALAALETLCSHGLLWEKISGDTFDLIDALTAVVVMD